MSWQFFGSCDKIQLLNHACRKIGLDSSISIIEDSRDKAHGVTFENLRHIATTQLRRNPVAYISLLHVEWPKITNALIKFGTASCFIQKYCCSPKNVCRWAKHSFNIENRQQPAEQPALLHRWFGVPGGTDSQRQWLGRHPSQHRPPPEVETPQPRWQYDNDVTYRGIKVTLTPEEQLNWEGEVSKCVHRIRNFWAEDFKFWKYINYCGSWKLSPLFMSVVCSRTEPLSIHRHGVKSVVYKIIGLLYRVKATKCLVMALLSLI